MVVHTILGVIGITGILFGVWMLAWGYRQHPEQRPLHDRVYYWMGSLDSVWVGFGWVTWMGVFGGFVSYSITGQGIV